MLDILHNRVTKKVNGSLKETEGLLIVSGLPKWQSLPGPEEGDETVYTATFIDPRITAGHVMVLAKKSMLPPYQDGDDLEFSDYDIGDGYISFTITDATVIANRYKISIVLYDSTILETPSGMPMSLTSSVAFSNWNLVNIGDEIIPHFSGTVAVKIDDEMLAPFLATIVYSSFYLICNDGAVSINGIKEFLPDGQIVCFANFLPNSSDDLIPPISADNADIEFLYIASDNVRVALPEVNAEWTQRLIVDEYTATFNVGEGLLDENVAIKDLIVVRGENGEEFPVLPMSIGPGRIKETPAMYSMLTIDKTTGSDVINVFWRRDTMPETSKLIAEVLVKNYKDPEGFIPPMP